LYLFDGGKIGNCFSVEMGKKHFFDVKKREEICADVQMCKCANVRMGGCADLQMLA
jgi:hypothetical protein